MHVEANRSAMAPRSTARTFVVRVLAAAIGGAVIIVALYWGIGAVRTYMEPEASVHLSCSWSDHLTCPASWTSDGRRVQGTAADPYSAHRYSRVETTPRYAVLKMHVSGAKATMQPDWWSIPGALFGLAWGIAIVLAPYRRRGRRQGRAPHAATT